jgi:hypothetical protein
MSPPGGWIEKDGYATESEQRDENHIQFRRYWVEQQNTVARFEAGASHLIGDAGGRGIELSKAVASIKISVNMVSMNIDDGRVSAEFGRALQQDLGDIHFARSFE